MKYYITGDCHRHFRKVEFFCRHHGTTKEDVMILLGDVGINFFLDDSDRELKEELSKLPGVWHIEIQKSTAKPWNRLIFPLKIKLLTLYYKYNAIIEIIWYNMNIKTMNLRKEMNRDDSKT